MFGAIYALLALGLNLQWGHTGLVNLGFVAFFAIGAYAAALLTLNGLPFAVATAVALAVAGLAGAVYAHYIGYISPDQFDPSLTFLVFTGVVIGGSSHWGAALGTLVFIALTESTRFLSDYGLPVSQAAFAQIRLILIGLVL